VLAAANRLTSGPMFAETVRRGRRAGTASLVVHLLARDGAAGAAGDDQLRVGFVVSKRVGNAVTRNTVKRRLRHLVRERASSLPGSVVLVVRALPPAAHASAADLRSDLDRALSRALGRCLSGGTAGGAR
jgi:ribonuclease P protein component